jgi:hypothetical protein
VAFIYRRDLLRVLAAGGMAVSPVGRSAFARDGNKRDAKHRGAKPVDAKQSEAKRIVCQSALDWGSDSLLMQFEGCLAF